MQNVLVINICMQVMLDCLKVVAIVYLEFRGNLQMCINVFCDQLEIPKQLHDPNVFGAWMVCFHNILETPVPLEGQPSDPEQRKGWGWWKVKKWTMHIMNRLYHRPVV